MILTVFLGKKDRILKLQLLKCKYVLVYVFLYGSKLNIFGLWTVLDIEGHHLGLWERLMDTPQFSDILRTFFF